MDINFRIDLRILYDIADGTFHVPCIRTFAQANVEILWNQMGGYVRFRRTALFHFSILYVDCESDPGQTNVASVFGIQEEVRNNLRIR